MALLLPLAEALGVSVTELLSGARDPETPPRTPEAAPPARDTAGDLLSYTQRALSQRWGRLRLWLLAGLGGALLLAALVCWICDTALGGALSWSLVVDLSLLLAWAVLLPLLAARRRPLAWALGALSAAILPYLYGLGRLLDDPRVFRLGLPIAPAAAVCLWTAWALCRRLRRRKLLAAGALLLLAMVLSLYVNAVAAALTGGAVHLGDCLPTLALAAACLLADFVLRRRRETA